MNILERLIGFYLNENLVTDPMSTFYRANSIRSTYGLIIEKLILNRDPTYIAINRVFFWIGIFIEAILSLSFLSRARIGVLKKDFT